MKWDRIRFFTKAGDYRPAIWPPMGPYWCSGQGEDYYVLVGYFPYGTTDEKIKEYWPEGYEIDRMQENIDIKFSDRFPKPDWWKEEGFMQKFTVIYTKSEGFYETGIGMFPDSAGTYCALVEARNFDDVCDYFMDFEINYVFDGHSELYKLYKPGPVSTIIIAPKE